MPAPAVDAHGRPGQRLAPGVDHAALNRPALLEAELDRREARRTTTFSRSGAYPGAWTVSTVSPAGTWVNRNRPSASVSARGCRARTDPIPGRSRPRDRPARGIDDPAGQLQPPRQDRRLAATHVVQCLADRPVHALVIGVRERDRDPTAVDPGRHARALPSTLSVGRGGARLFEVLAEIRGFPPNSSRWSVRPGRPRPAALARPAPRRRSSRPGTSSGCTTRGSPPRERGLGNQSVTGANPSLRTTTDRNFGIGAGIATAARPATSVVVALAGLPIGTDRQRDARHGLSGPLVHEADLDRGTVALARGRFGSRRLMATRPAPADLGRSRRTSRRASRARPRQRPAMIARGDDEGGRQLELRHDHGAEHAVGQLERRHRRGNRDRRGRRGAGQRGDRRGDERGRNRRRSRLAASGQRGQPDGRSQAAAGQAVAQLLPRPVEPPAKAPRRASQAGARPPRASAPRGSRAPPAVDTSRAAGRSPRRSTSAARFAPSRRRARRPRDGHHSIPRPGAGPNSTRIRAATR